MTHLNFPVQKKNSCGKAFVFLRLKNLTVKIYSFDYDTITRITGHRRPLLLCTSQCKPRPPDPRDIAGDVTFLQCYISTFTPALGGICTVTIPAPRALVSKARRALPSRGVWGHAPQKILKHYSQRRIFLHSEALLKMVNTRLVESMAICHFIGFP